MTSNSRKWLVLIGVSLASFLGCVDFTIVNTALPAIQTNLHTTVEELQWIINIFLLALCALMVVMGRAADIHGRRKLLYIGIFGFGFASLGAGLSNTISLLIGFRLLQGIATAILYTASGAIVSNAFPKAERGKAMGVLFGINGIGLAIGPVLGGLIVSALSWRWVFLVNVPVILISFLFCILSVKESYNNEHGTDIDWWGLVFLTLGLCSLILGIIKGDEWGWTSRLTLFTFVIAAISLVLLYVIEHHHSSPIIKFSLFANRLFITSISATFALGFFYCLAFFLMPLFLQSIQGYEGYQLGFMLLPTTAVMALLSPVVGRATDQFGPKPLLLIGLVFFIISALLQAKFAADSSLLFIIVAFAAMGAGWAAILGPSTVAALSAVPESVGGVAMGSSWTLHNIGAVMGLASGTVVYHYFAIRTLFKLTMQAGAPWIDSAVANPSLAVALIQQHAGNVNALSTFQEFFMSGYHGAMILLVFSSAIAFAIIAIFMPKRNSHLHVRVDELGEYDKQGL